MSGGSGDGGGRRKGTGAGGTPGWRGGVSGWVLGLAAAVVFLGAVRLLGSSASHAAPWLREHLPFLLSGDLPSLGSGWLAAYAALNGSVVAAVGVTLFVSGAVAAAPYLLIVAGSRLGAAAFVVLVGALDHLRRRGNLRRAVGLGVLTFVVTHTVYLPATALARSGVPAVVGPAGRLMRALRVELPGMTAVGNLAGEVVEGVGAPAAFGLALLLLFASVRLFDRMLDRVDEEELRERWLGRLRSRWVSLALGMAVTLASVSVSFSVGVVVPLYNRGHVSRREIVPYLLGANLTTLADTAAVAVFLDSPPALGVVALLTAAVAIVTAVALAAYPAYFGLVNAVAEAVETDRTVFALFAAALAVVPLLLVGVGLV